MKALLKKQRRARELRAQGWSVKRITQELCVSQSSVSVWVRGVDLTTEQQQALHEANLAGQRAATKAHAENCQLRREQWWQEGEQHAQLFTPLHLAGCMLYWAEGSKYGRRVELSNTDRDMLVLFLRFLRETFGLTPDDVYCQIHVYLNNGLSQHDVRHYWSESLGIPVPQIAVSVKPDRHTSRKAVHPYGVCHLRVYRSVRWFTHIMGAIQQYKIFMRE